jgi:hypothetical protein
MPSLVDGLTRLGAPDVGVKIVKGGFAFLTYSKKTIVTKAM